MTDIRSSEPKVSALMWWCPTCRTDVHPEAVTFDEHHDVRAGGCGDRVGSKPKELPSSNSLASRLRTWAGQDDNEVDADMRAAADEIERLQRHATAITEDRDGFYRIAERRRERIEQLESALAFAARPAHETPVVRYPHWTCRNHGDFDARVVVGCPECTRQMREGLKLIATDEHRLMNETARQTAASLLSGKPALPAGATGEPCSCFVDERTGDIIGDPCPACLAQKSRTAENGEASQ